MNIWSALLALVLVIAAEALTKSQSLLNDSRRPHAAEL